VGSCLSISHQSALATDRSWESKQKAVQRSLIGGPGPQASSSQIYQPHRKDPLTHVSKQPPASWTEAGGEKTTRITFLANLSITLKGPGGLIDN
jgi:hypothetical protein